MAELHDLLGMDSYWETLGLNGLWKRQSGITRKLTTRSWLYAVSIANSPTIVAGPNALSLSHSKITIAIIAISVLSLSTNCDTCNIKLGYQPQKAHFHPNNTSSKCLHESGHEQWRRKSKWDRKFNICCILLVYSISWLSFAVNHFLSGHFPEVKYKWKLYMHQTLLYNYSHLHMLWISITCIKMFNMW